MTLALADGVLGVRRLEGATPLGAVTASGPLALNADGAVRPRPTRSAAFRWRSSAAQIGEVTGTVDVDGRLQGPRATLRTEGTARFSGVEAGTTRAGPRRHGAVHGRSARLGPRHGSASTCIPC